jgi:signal transduction histidine kinase
VVEPAEAEFDALALRLQRGALAESSVERAQSVADALDRVQAHPYAAVIVDLGDGDGNTWEGFDQIVSAAGNAAVLALIGWHQEALAEEAMRRGAQDFLIKRDRRVSDISQKVEYAVTRQRLLHTLREAHENETASRDQFLSRVSHELRTPLAVVHEFASLLADEIGGEMTEQQKEFLTVVTRNVDQLGVMVDDLLAMSRAQRDKVAINCSTVEPEQIVVQTAEAFERLAAAKGITLAVRVPKPLPDVVADPARVREVLGNLLDNSLKFTPAGGAITVSAEAEPPMVRITVSDTGAGIPAEDLPHIFDQFFQSHAGSTSKGGLGLGLFVCHDLVTRLGGQMSAQSEPGQGTSIAFTLPIAG